MFYTLLAVTFAIAFSVSWIVVNIFKKPADKIFQRIIQDDIASAWTTYLKFALFVAGISSGIRLRELERYIIAPRYAKKPQMEIYRTIVETLQGLAWVLLTFFIISLAAFVLVRLIEVLRKNRTTNTAEQGNAPRP